jgi:hypothetical protein
MNTKFFNLLFFLVVAAAFPQTDLSGNIGGMTLEKGGNPFIIDKNITIPAGKKLTILEGCVFLFKPFTGMVVEGSVSVEGTAENPVIFTTFNDSIHNPAAKQPPDPFDWNGIIINPKARRVHLAHFILKYSVYGVQSHTYELIIASGIFTGNGQYHFTINGEIQPVTDNQPFNFGAETTPAQPPVEKSKPSIRWKRPASIFATAAGLGGLGVMGYFLYRMNDYNKKYDGSVYPPYLDSVVTLYNSARRTAIIAGTAGGVVLAAGVVLFAVDLHERKQVTAALYPAAGYGIGILAHVDF